MNIRGVAWPTLPLLRKLLPRKFLAIPMLPALIKSRPISLARALKSTDKGCVEGQGLLRARMRQGRRQRGRGDRRERRRGKRQACRHRNKQLNFLN